MYTDGLKANDFAYALRFRFPHNLIGSWAGVLASPPSLAINHERNGAKRRWGDGKNAEDIGVARNVKKGYGSCIHRFLALKRGSCWIMTEMA